MKNKLRFLFTTSLAFVLSVLFMINVSAESVYIIDGYSYQEGSYGVYLCGWDNSDKTLSVPSLLGSTRVYGIANYGFSGDDYITSVDFSDANYLTEIGTQAFANSVISGNLYLTSTIRLIGNAAFRNSKIETLEYNSKTGVIPTECFQNCSELNTVSINSAITSIEAYAFQNCISLKEITIPKTVTSINSTAFNGCTDFTIKGYRDSYAQKFAEDNGYEFEILDPLYGDANSDGKVNILDVTAIQKYKIGEQDLSDYGLKCADVNKDGSVTIRDATLIQMKLAKYDVDF